MAIAQVIVGTHDMTFMDVKEEIKEEKTAAGETHSRRIRVTTLLLVQQRRIIKGSFGMA